VTRKRHSLRSINEISVYYSVEKQMILHRAVKFVKLLTSREQTSTHTISPRVCVDSIQSQCEIPTFALSLRSASVYFGEERLNTYTRFPIKVRGLEARELGECASRSLLPPTLHSPLLSTATRSPPRSLLAHKED
jgi:hypothetical protein